MGGEGAVCVWAVCVVGWGVVCVWADDLQCLSQSGAEIARGTQLQAWQHRINFL